VYKVELWLGMMTEKCYNLENKRLLLGIYGTDLKDQSRYLVAGSMRSFPQTSEVLRVVSCYCNVNQMIVLASTMNRAAAQRDRLVL